MKQLLAFMILVVSIASCTKNNGGYEGNPDQPLIFTSLMAETDTIGPGESTKITAVASGYKLAYYWSTDAGNILETGSQVVYAASPCHVGRNKVVCKVTDGNNTSLSKEIYIVVQ
jgi:hypothetical protein